MPNSSDDLFGRLFSKSHRALRVYVRRLVDSRETADDIVQEAFLRTYVHADRVKVPRAFLFSTARNLAADSWRHNRVAKTDLLGDSVDSEVVSLGESPEGQAVAEEQSPPLTQRIDRRRP